MFELTNDEILKCQFDISRWGGNRKGVFAFTEMGVAMLSSVLAELQSSPQKPRPKIGFIQD